MLNLVIAIAFFALKKVSNNKIKDFECYSRKYYFIEFPKKVSHQNVCSDYETYSPVTTKNYVLIPQPSELGGCSLD